MNDQRGSADGLDPSAYEDAFSEGEGADAADRAEEADGADETQAAVDEFAAGEEAFSGEEADAASWDGGEDLATGPTQAGGHSWHAFEAEIADALDASEADEFLGRLRDAIARGAASGGAPGRIASLLGTLTADRAAEEDAFDALGDAFEDGADEALPAMVGLAARGLARGLGHRNVAQLGQAARRALVRGVASAARTLVHRHGPRGARALGRLAPLSGNAAARGARHPQQAVQRVAQLLPRVARRIVQYPVAVQRLAQPLAARVVRSAVPAGPVPRSRSATQVLRLQGPVEIVIRQR